MRLIVGFGIALVYIVVGCVVVSVISSVEGEELESIECWVMWPILILMYLFMRVVSKDRKEERRGKRVLDADTRVSNEDSKNIAE